MNIPAGHQAVMPYLIVKDAVRFIDFTEKVFNATVTSRFARDGDESVIMHAEINIDGSTIMFAESNEQFGVQNSGMFVYVANADEIFARAKVEGAAVIMELSNQDYGRTCGVKDPFGNVWWITSVLAK